VGITRSENLIDIAVMEDCARADMNKNAPRAMAVLEPLRVVCTNFPEGKVAEVSVPNFPSEPERGTHAVPFSRVFYIERADFMVDPPKGYFRLSPGATVGLRHLFLSEGKYAVFKCTDFSLSEDDPDVVVEVEVELEEVDEKPKKLHYIHFVAEPAPGQSPCKAEFRLYEDLFTDPRPSNLGDDWMSAINPNSEVVTHGYVDTYAAGTCPTRALSRQTPPLFACLMMRQERQLEASSSSNGWASSPWTSTPPQS
jgi:glutaminyl-tRNA synthetase